MPTLLVSHPDCIAHDPGAGHPEAPARLTAVLKEENGKTRLTATCLYPSLAVRDMVLQTGMEKGAALSYDALEDVASRLAS